MAKNETPAVTETTKVNYTTPEVQAPQLSFMDNLKIQALHYGAIAKARWDAATPKQRTCFCVALAVLLFISYRWMTSTTPAPLAQAGATQQLPNGATKTVGGPGTETFTVAAVKRLGSRCFLNSEANFRSPSCRTIVLEGPAAAVQIEQLVGKTVVAQGLTGTYNGKPQLVVNDPAGVQVK